MKNIFAKNQNSVLLFIFSLLIIASSCDKKSDDPIIPPILSINSNSIEEGNDGNTELGFTISMDKTSEETVLVRYASRTATALEGSDFVSKTGNISIPPGDTESEIFIEIIGDNNLEEDELFEVALSNATNGCLLYTSPSPRDATLSRMPSSA